MKTKRSSNMGTTKHKVFANNEEDNHRQMLEANMQLIESIIPQVTNHENPRPRKRFPLEFNTKKGTATSNFAFGRMKYQSTKNETSLDLPRIDSSRQISNNNFRQSMHLRSNHSRELVVNEGVRASTHSSNNYPRKSDPSLRSLSRSHERTNNIMSLSRSQRGISFVGRKASRQRNEQVMRSYLNTSEINLKKRTLYNATQSPREY